MNISRNHFRKTCALAAACLVVPAMAFAGSDKGKGNDGDDKGKQKGRGEVHSVPEGGPGMILLIASVGAILLFTTRRTSNLKA